jgi:hypothetical protein
MKEENTNDKEFRKIYINYPELNLFCNNSVKKAKYDIFTFLPLGIFTNSTIILIFSSF